MLLTRNVFKEPAELLGVSGIAVTAADEPAEIGIALNDADIDFAIDSIVLLGASRGGIVPQIRIGERLLNPVTSDTTLRRYSYALDEKVDSFHIVLPCVEGQSFAVTGVYVASAKPGITVHSIGVNGAALRDYLDKCPYFNTDLTMMCPDLVIFGIGINDASGDNFDTVLFRQKYMRLIDSIRSVSPECVFLFVTNNDSFRRIRRNYIVNSNATLARDVFYRLADATGGAVWDQFSIMGGLGSMAQWQQASLAQKDKVHFTRTGYTLIGDMMSNALYETLLMLNGIDAPIGSDAAKALTRHNTAAGDGKKNDNAESGYIYY